MSSRSWVRCFVSTTFLCTCIKYQGILGKCNCVFSLGGNTYNISSLTSTSGARLVFNQKYIKIGTQSSEECGFYKHTKIPKLQYSMGIWKAAVLLKCDRNEKEGIFKVREDEHQDDYEFTLTHQCACANSCLFRPSTHTTKEPRVTTDPSDPVDVAVPIVASVAGVLGLVIVPIIIWRLLIRRPQNNERQHLLDQDDGNRRIDESENHFSGGSEASELTLGRGSSSSANTSSTSGSSCSDITETNKNSFNNKTNRNAEGHC